MSIIYLETSALVKRYVEEAGTEAADRLFDEKLPDEFFSISTLAVLELKSALRRLVKAGRIRESQYRDLIAEFTRDAASISLILPVNDALMEEAATALESHALRAGDAIHFATILQVKQVADDTRQPLIVVTSDLELLEACGQEWLTTLRLEDEDALKQLMALRGARYEQNQV